MEVPLSQCRPSPENDRLYRPVDPADPDVLALADSVRRHGVMEPLAVTLDGWLLSGHRRRAAAVLAGLDVVPCRVEPIRRTDDPDAFMRLLREFNRQREKTRDEKLREAVVEADPREAYQSLIEHRSRQSAVSGAPMELSGVKHRAAISAGKRPFLGAVLAAIEERRGFWPLSDRQIHYALLNAPPLRHDSKPGSRYANDRRSYNDLTDLLTRARLAGDIPMHAIGDETRPVEVWDTFRETGAFVRRELDGFLKGFWRDLMQSQPHHVEIVGEKNTVLPVLRPVASRYTIPLTVGRGYCSLPPRQAMARRYRESGKNKLVLLILSDFDPDGEEIAHSFGRSMRDDFGVDDVHAVKVALTAEQVRAHRLPPVMKAKEGSAHHGKFTARHGEDVFELEALPPATLQKLLEEAVDAVLDIAAFNAEVDTERTDAAYLQGVRRTVYGSLHGITDFDGTHEPYSGDADADPQLEVKG